MKVLRMSFTILHQMEVPDDFTDEDCEELVDIYASENGFERLYNDKEWDLSDD